MASEMEYAIQKLKDAVLSLKVGISNTKDDLDKDGVIQRFEFTFELFQKALKVFLEKEGVSVKTPMDSLKAAFKVGVIDDEEACLNMLDDRNRLSHIYSQEQSEKIFEKIKSCYGAYLEKCTERLASKK